MQQPLTAVACRDLKLDNTLLDGHYPPTIKICDFGFAKGWTADSNMYTHIGYGCMQRRLPVLLPDVAHP